MKNFVKIVMPIAAFVLASAGAVSTKSTDGKSGSIQGFQRISVGNCNPLKMCNNLPGPPCKAGAVTVYAWANNDCQVPLTHDTTQP